MPMELKTTEHVLKIVVIAPQGRLDALESPALRAECDKYFDMGYVHFVLDLTDLTMMDSAGLAVLVAALKRARQGDGDVRLIWPVNEDAKRVLQLTKFDKVFTSITPAEIVPKGI